MTAAARETSLDTLSRWTLVGYVAATVLVLLLMMGLGLAMRMGQAQMVSLPPEWFYRLMTAHGAGMVGIAGLGGSAVMWYFLKRYVDLSPGIFLANLVLFLIGALLLLGAIFLGGFAAGWTFLYPLPAHPQGMWGTAAAAAFLAGLLLIGVGFLLFYLDAGRAILQRYGSLARALGWPQLFGTSADEAPPPTIVASTMVLSINTLALVVGAAILTMSLINLFLPAFAIDALLAKNMIFFFGHVFINATIYMGVIALYEILPVYAGRPWKASRIFLAAWSASLVMVLIVYPHHFLMDFVMPQWALIMGQVISYTSGLPVLLVTGYGALTLVYRSGIKWDVTSGLLMLGAFGWAAGVIPAIIDGTIRINEVMHNTLWVPGHFHFYLLLGLVSMIFAFMYYLVKRDSADGAVERAGFWVFAAGGLGFVFMFLLAGTASVPRRYAVHLAEWVSNGRVASIFAAVALVGALLLAARFLARIRVAATP